MLVKETQKYQKGRGISIQGFASTSTVSKSCLLIKRNACSRSKQGPAISKAATAPPATNLSRATEVAAAHPPPQKTAFTVEGLNRARTALHTTSAACSSTHSASPWI